MLELHDVDLRADQAAQEYIKRGVTCPIHYLADGNMKLLIDTFS